VFFFFLILLIYLSHFDTLSSINSENDTNRLNCNYNSSFDRTESVYNVLYNHLRKVVGQGNVRRR